MVQPDSPFPSLGKKPQTCLLSPCMGLYPHTQTYIHTAVHLCACIPVGIPGDLHIQKYINPEIPTPELAADKNNTDTALNAMEACMYICVQV